MYVFKNQLGGSNISTNEKKNMYSDTIFEEHVNDVEGSVTAIIHKWCMINAKLSKGTVCEFFKT